MTRPPRPVDGVLFLYHHFRSENAPTIREHIDAFSRHSRHPVFAVNTDFGFLRVLRRFRFRVIVLHYSLFGDYYHLNKRYLRYLAGSSDAYKVAFFQDEHRYCGQRFEFLKRYGVDSVYSLLDPPWAASVYGQGAGVLCVRTTLTGYVSDDLVERATALTVPDAERTIDIGYRGRRLPPWMGRASQEKHEIGERFSARGAGLNLRLDIDTSESSRIYGNAWYEFVAQCRGMLGVEAGTSIFDLDDSARERTEVLLAAEPDLTFDELEQRLLHQYEDRIPYRTISPRHFEAAAFRVVQILYEGHYSGVLEPDTHYLALRKDMSNLEDVLDRFRDPNERHRLTQRAYDELIDSGRYSYASFVADFDGHLARAGLDTRMSDAERASTSRLLRRSERRLRRIKEPVRAVRDFAFRAPFPGRTLVRAAYRRFRGHR